MKEDLLSIIKNITQFGLKPNMEVEKTEVLEENLIRIYHMSFNLYYVYDDNDYADFESPNSIFLRDNIATNLPHLGLYQLIDNNAAFGNNILVGDAVDDLLDIIIDLLEVEWRVQNNSFDDGIWYFKMTFLAHTKQHVLNLLNYLEM